MISVSLTGKISAPPRRAAKMRILLENSIMGPAILNAIRAALGLNDTT
jgi:hypothetical protein